jgi:cell wall-associated NlpC family hydrolase
MKPGALHPNPTAHLEGAGEALYVSTPVAGRHRSPARARTPLTAISQAVSTNATPAVKASAVLAVSGGLVASLGMQANATPTHQGSAPQTHDVSSAAAPAFGDSSFSATTVASTSSTTLRAPGHAIAPASRAAHVSRGTARSVIGSRMVSYGPIKPVKAGAPGSAEFGAAVMAIAARYAGIAYRYGGTTPAGFDCSGYVRYVMAQVGVSLPRTSSEQRAATVRISASEAVPGDLVFFPGHVGIYAGNGMMWDSPHTGGVVSKRAVYSSSATYGRVG